MNRLSAILPILLLTAAAIIPACDKKESAETQPTQGYPAGPATVEFDAGDRIVAVDGEPVGNFKAIVLEAVLGADAEEAADAKPVTVVSQSDAAGGVTVATLSNGLTVIVKPHRAVPIVCVKSYVHTGGMHEGKWLGAGLSHLAEHLVAEDATHDGAKGRSEEGDNRVTAIGGQSNASTSQNWTQYYISASASKTGQCIDLIADWMDRPQITKEAFEREHGVVQRELEMRADSPSRQLWQAHSAEVYREHPAGVPVIGYKGPLAALTYQDVLDYVHQRYVPQNMIFCVVGDVETAAVLKRVCEAFAGSLRGRTPDLSLPPVKPFAGVRRTVLYHKDARQAAQIMSFQTIPLVHEDLYALDVLSYVLTNGESSRLSRSLVREKKLVTSVSSYSWTPSWGKGEFAVTFRSDPDKADAAQRAVMAGLATVRDALVSEVELARAKRQKVADYVYSQQSIEDIADTLATDYMTTGDVAFSRNYAQQIQSVTREQVRAAARKYLTFDRMVITRQLPAVKTTVSDSTSSPADTQSKATVFTLPSGLQVVLQPNDAVGLVAMTYSVLGGLLGETDATNGYGTLMTALSTQGAGSRTAEEIAAFFDSAGGGIGGSAGNNTLYWQATVLDDRFAPAMDIFADVILRPRFEAKELEILRPQYVAAIKAIDEKWASQFHRFFRQKYYGSGPYGRVSLGRLDVVQAATTKALTDYHRRYVLGASGVLSVYGHFDPVTTRAAIEKLFAAPKPPASWAPTDTAPRKIDPAGELHVLKTTNQVAGVIVAVPGMTLKDPDRFAIDVLDTLISGYHLPTGWLHNELRGKQLVYAVHAYNWNGLLPGAFMVDATCQPDKAAEVLGIIRKNLARAVEYTPTQAEVDRAVNVILTAKLLGGQEASTLSMDAALNQLYGFGYDYRSRLEAEYSKVTPAEVNRVARKYLTRPQVVVISTPQPDVVEAPNK